MKLKLKIFSAFILIVFISGCANIVSPDGGERDSKAPVPVKVNPPDFSMGVRAHSVSFLFDEVITLDNPSQIFLSPATENQPEIKWHGKHLEIEWKDSLKANTTYALNFGNAVRDVTEGNVLLDFQYIFSTGDHLDSAVVTGTVVNAKDNSPAKKVMVMLQTPANDSSVYHQKPVAFTRTDDAGNFSLRYLKPGNYHLYAINDKNSNLLYDPVEEDIAFLDSTIQVADSTGGIRLRMFRSEPDSQKLLSAESVSPGLIRLVFAKPVKEFSSNSIPDAISFPTNLNRDSFQCWFPQLMLDSVPVTCTADGINFSKTIFLKTVSDTVSFRKSFLGISAGLSGGKSGFLLTNDSVLKLKFNHPVLSGGDESKIILRDDSTKKQLSFHLQMEEENKINFSLLTKFPAGTSYSLLIPKSTFHDLFGLTNDSTAIHFRTTTQEETGTLQLNLYQADSIHHWLVFIYDQKGNLMLKQKLTRGKNPFAFKNLLPGNLKIQAVRDDNNNGRWDSGNFKKQIQPEEIFSAPSIGIRANWDLEQNLEIGNKGFLKLLKK